MRKPQKRRLESKYEGRKKTSHVVVVEKAKLA